MAASRTTTICKMCSRLRHISRHRTLLQTTAYYSTLPPPAEASAQYPEHIVSLVQSISQLNLLEVSKLNELLKKELNIQDAPMMPMAGMMAAAPAESAEEEMVQEAQTDFTVKLLKFDDKTKVKLIKEIKLVMPDMNLVMAKKFVEGTPQTVKDKVTKEEAESLKAQLEAVGGTVEIE